MSIGVYCILNNRTGLMYIGASKNVEGRLYNHFNLLRNNKHHSFRLQAAYNQYGHDAFSSKLLKECSIKDLRSCERWYLFNEKPRYNINLPTKL